MQKFMLLSSVASAAAFLTASDGTAVGTGAASETPPVITDELSEEEKQALKFIPEKPTGAQSAKPSRFKPAVPSKELLDEAKQKAGPFSFTCRAASYLGDEKKFKDPKQKAGENNNAFQKRTDKKNQDFYDACVAACDKDHRCHGLEIGYEYHSGYNLKSAGFSWKYQSWPAKGFVKSCQLVKNTKLAQFRALASAFTKAERKAFMAGGKKRKEVVKDWITKTNEAFAMAAEVLGKNRAPGWHEQITNKKIAAMKTPDELFGYVDQHAWGAFQCFEKTLTTEARAQLRKDAGLALDHYIAIKANAETFKEKGAAKVAYLLQLLDAEQEFLGFRTLLEALAGDADLVAKLKQLKDELIALQADLNTQAPITPETETKPEIKEEEPKPAPKKSDTDPPKKKGCNKKLYWLLVLLLIPIALVIFFVCRPSKQ